MKFGGNTMNRRLALNSEQLEEKKKYNLSIFHKWLYDEIDEDNFSIDKMQIIENCQIMLDMIVCEETILKICDQLKLSSINQLINNKACLEVASAITGINKDIIIAKAICMKKNKENQSKKVK